MNRRTTMDIDIRPVTAEEFKTWAADLAATYLGGVRIQLWAGRDGPLRGHIEGSPGALARADRMFAWNPLPFCSMTF